MTFKGQVGGQLTTHQTPERKKRLAKKRRREEKHWKSLAGPVVVTYKDTEPKP